MNRGCGAGAAPAHPPLGNRAVLLCPGLSAPLCQCLRAAEQRDSWGAALGCVGQNLLALGPGRRWVGARSWEEEEEEEAVLWSCVLTVPCASPQFPKQREQAILPGCCVSLWMTARLLQSFIFRL